MQNIPSNSNPTAQLFDIYDVQYDPWWLNTWVWYIFLLVGTVTVVSLFLLAWKKWGPQKRVAYWQQALLSIERLGNEFDNPREFYGQLTGIIKRYLEERYALPLVGKTDTELIEDLKHDSSISVQLYEDVKQIFDGVTYIKFAHQTAAVEHMKHAQRIAMNIIKTTHVVDKEKRS